jgi:hypothetical protein
MSRLLAVRHFRISGLFSISVYFPVFVDLVKVPLAGSFVVPDGNMETVFGYM